MPEPAYKYCPSCDQHKPLDGFGRHSGRPDGLQAECRECRRIRLREWRRKNPEKLRAQRQRAQARANEANKRWKCADPRRASAHSAVARALRRGALVRPEVCDRCGGKAARIEAHHADYDKWLEVEWLCSVCHSDERGKSAA